MGRRFRHNIMSRETEKAGIAYPCLTGDIANTPGQTVHEPDHGVVHSAKWRPFDTMPFPTLRS